MSKCVITIKIKDDYGVVKDEMRTIYHRSLLLLAKPKVVGLPKTYKITKSPRCSTYGVYYKPLTENTMFSPSRELDKFKKESSIDLLELKKFLERLLGPEADDAINTFVGIAE